MKFSLFIFTFLIYPLAALSQAPDNWEEDEQFKLRSSGVLKSKKRKFYYKVGSHYAGSKHYSFAIRLSWKASDPNDSTYVELTGAASDSPDGKLTMKGNTLYLTSETIQSEDPKTGKYIMAPAVYCWEFIESSEDFKEKDDCDEPKKKQKPKKTS